METESRGRRAPEERSAGAASGVWASWNTRLRSPGLYSGEAKTSQAASPRPAARALSTATSNRLSLTHPLSQLLLSLSPRLLCHCLWVVLRVDAVGAMLRSPMLALRGRKKSEADSSCTVAARRGEGGARNHRALASGTGGGLPPGPRGVTRPASSGSCHVGRGRACHRSADPRFLDRKTNALGQLSLSPRGPDNSRKPETRQWLRIIGDILV
jgi:hypothetical protein